ncbi:DUF5671 domain-containing protein [Microbacterium esteraromaticum]|uniref:DUF5671 domain-containing protein n=1 Tax=Microbacterium esteraromaticum TaxID=57043 RepID=UPI001CD408ED|nr:DUF5671 domain-containing protein [Microbacterium esteraromaticum]MCA1307973.1 DUF5671 domain-containing protein [Microbacterium esteraromaticum]
MAAPANPVPPPRSAQAIVRRIILYALLFALVCVAAAGLSGLADRALSAGAVLVDDDAGLARSLAFTVIGVPLGAGLWWFLRRRLADPGERASLVWALYVTAMIVTSLIVASISLGLAATAGLDGHWRPGQLASGVVWTGIWLWHVRLRSRSATAPTRLVGLPLELSSLYALAIAAFGAVSALSALLSEALVDASHILAASRPWPIAVLQGLVWLLLGTTLWWWHWFYHRVRSTPGVFADVVLVAIVGISAGAGLFALGTTLYVGLRLIFDTAPSNEVLAPLDVAVATALVAAAVWVHHSAVLAQREHTARLAGRLVISAIALVGAASGFGVVINALLAVLAPTLSAHVPRTLLLGGISALAVGAIAWWVAWRPTRTTTTADAAEPARRVYLVAVFGASAIVGLITLLIIGYRLFDFLLDDARLAALVEQIRAPLGLLSATAVVFGYHFAIWRHDRRIAPSAARRASIGRVILVTADADDPRTAQLSAQIAESTGAAVTVWRAAEGATLAPLAPAEATPAPRAHVELPSELASIQAPRVLVVSLPDSAPMIVPLAD